MAGVLYRLGRLCANRAVVVVAVWLGVVVLVRLVVWGVGAETSNDLSLPGTESQQATDLLASRFPPQQNGSSPIVFHVTKGKITDAANKQAVESSYKALAKAPHVASAPDPFANAASGLVSKDVTTAFTPVLLDIPNGDVTEEIANRILDTTEPARKAGVGVSVGGNLGGVLSKSPTESSEVIGLLAAMLILALTFGSLVAMGMPIITAVVGLAIGLGLIGLLGHVVTIPTVGPTLATMIGLGVGIDYALFLVTKHRDQTAHGMERHESIARAVVGAAFGVLVATFQWGWGLDLVGLSTPYGTVAIASYVPLMMFAALFGLSMDYEVFLVSQIAQHHAAGEPPRQGRPLGPRLQRQGDRGGGDHHDLGVRQLHPQRRPDDQAVRRGAVGCGAAGQRHGPVTRAGDADAVRTGGLVTPTLAVHLLPHVDIEGEAEPTTQEPAAVPQHQGATAGGAPPDGEGHADGRLPDQTMPTTHAWPEPSTPVHEPTAPADGHRDHAPDD